jgi:hypothetical protein
MTRLKVAPVCGLDDTALWRETGHHCGRDDQHRGDDNPGSRGLAHTAKGPNCPKMVLASLAEWA